MAELNRISGQKITLDIGGYKCSTSLQTLRAEPESMLGTMFSGRHPITKQNDGSVFIDRDGTHFRIILNYLRGGITSTEQLPDNKLQLLELLTEVNYYQLKGLEKIIKSEEKEPLRVIKQEEITNALSKRRYSYHTYKAISFRNSNLNNLRFENIYFSHSLDLSGSSLTNTTFRNCYFGLGVQFSFDRTDLNCCTIIGCKEYRPFEIPVNGNIGIIQLIRQKKITFHNAKYIDFSNFDTETKKVIKETYCL